MYGDTLVNAIEGLVESMRNENAHGDEQVKKKYCVECNCAFDGNRFHYELFRSWKWDDEEWKQKYDIIWSGNSDKPPEGFGMEVLGLFSRFANYSPRMGQPAILLLLMNKSYVVKST